jgi:hypothetical protein
MLTTLVWSFWILFRASQYFSSALEKLVTINSLNGFLHY